MTLQTRQPTGMPPWPTLLLAGKPKVGKSYNAAAASAASVLGRTLWVSIGEADPDEYGAMDGAAFEIVTHDGTFSGILNAVRGAVTEPWTDDRPTLVVVDSITKLWDLVTTEAQGVANSRPKNRGREASITPDLWSAAKRKWHAVVAPLQAYQGPVILTARLDEVMLMDDAGQPTKEKGWKVQTEKNLPFDVDGVIEMRGRDDVHLTGVRSLRYDIPAGESRRVENFSVADVWRRMGIADGAVGDKHVSQTSAEPEPGSADFDDYLRQRMRESWTDLDALRELHAWIAERAPEHAALAIITDQGRALAQQAATPPTEPSPEPSPEGGQA